MYNYWAWAVVCGASDRSGIPLFVNDAKALVVVDLRLGAGLSKRGRPFADDDVRDGREGHELVLV